MRNQITTIIEKINDQAGEQLAQGAKTAREANDRFLDAVVETNRKAVDFAVTSFDRLSDQAPAVELPFELPTAAEAGKRYIDVVERLVELNRDFSKRVVDMLPADKPVKRTASKAKRSASATASSAKKTARKATAKK